LKSLTPQAQLAIQWTIYQLSDGVNDLVFKNLKIFLRARGNPYSNFSKSDDVMMSHRQILVPK